MEDYLQGNHDYWQQGYEAENVESFVFRPYGRILKAELGLDGSRHERLLDFGCGSGASLQFFKRKGFDVYGVDIAVPDIERCQRRMPDCADHFAVIDPKPSAGTVFFGGNFDIIMGIQAFYYFPTDDFQALMQSIYNQLRPGGIIWATMIGTKCWYYENSVDAGNGLREVRFQRPRVSVDRYFIQFTSSEEDLLAKFHLFEKVHVGYYDACYHEDEGSDFHYFFIGRKPLK